MAVNKTKANKKNDKKTVTNKTIKDKEEIYCIRCGKKSKSISTCTCGCNTFTKHILNKDFIIKPTGIACICGNDAYKVVTLNKEDQEHYIHEYECKSCGKRLVTITTNKL